MHLMNTFEFLDEFDSRMVDPTTTVPLMLLTSQHLLSPKIVHLKELRGVGKVFI